MELIEYSVNSGDENMAIDSDLLNRAIAKESDTPVFRTYGWKPMCISLGRNQKSDFLNVQNIDVVRRLTGGRALLHDNEVTYSCVFPSKIIPEGESIISSYKYISGILVDFFKTLNIELNFGNNKRVSTCHDYCMLLTTGADLCYKNKKIIGSAQYRKQGYILQHGSILFGYNKTLLENLFKEPISDITTIQELLPDTAKDEFINKFEKYIKNL